MFFLLRESLLRWEEALGLGLICVSVGQESCRKSKNQRWGGSRLQLLQTLRPDGERGREVPGGLTPTPAPHQTPHRGTPDPFSLGRVQGKGAKPRWHPAWRGLMGFCVPPPDFLTSPVRVSCSQQIAPTLGQCFKRSWGGGFILEGRFVCVGCVAAAFASLHGGLRSLVYCSFPKSLAFCSASALWATSPLPVLAT